MKHSHEPNYQNITIKKLPNSEVEIIGEIKAASFENYMKTAFNEIKKNIQIDGFRKGTAPDAMIEKQIGLPALLNEAAEMALGHDYGHIVEDYSLSVISRPQISITSMEKGKPLGFSIRVAVFPEVKLPDYKSIAKEEVKKKSPIPEVINPDIDETLENIRKSFAGANGEAKDAEGKEIPLPDLDDAFAQKLGNFKTIEELRARIKENLQKERESREIDKVRAAIGKALAEKTVIDVPEPLIEGELKKMLAQFKGDIEGLQQTTYEKYLTEMKKTEDDLKKEWRKDAIQRVTLQLALNAISKEEKIAATEEEIRKEVDAILSHYHGADPDHVRIYVETLLTNEKVFRFLESK